VSIVPTDARPAGGPLSPANAAEPRMDVGELYRAYGARVTRWVARMAGPFLDVEDLVQDVFVKAHQLLPQFRGDAEITTWLYRIAENLVISRRRRERVRRWLWRTQDVDPPIAYPTPLDALERREAQRLVYRLLDDVSGRYRVVFILFELEGLSGDEIAELTGIKLATVWVRLHRARTRFFARARKLGVAAELAGLAGRRP
jgi:RNA polymerase sigma-70 factor (ECF subfamily)